MIRGVWRIAALGHYATVLALVILSMRPLSSAWQEKIVYSFQGVSDGSTPVGRLVFDKAGNIFGVTSNGGSSSCISPFECGTVFKLLPPAISGDPWTETVLYVFKGNAAGDGTSPFGGLVMDEDGNLFGTTAYGGTGNCVLLGTKEGCGTVYELSRPTERGKPWTERVLYSFRGGEDGEVPNRDLAFDKAGNLYGATAAGGGHGSCDPYYPHCGTVFKLSRPKMSGGEWAETVLYGFNGENDGAAPNGGLLFYGGHIYGTTLSGGIGGNTDPACNINGVPGCGTVFKLTPPTKSGGPWTESVLHRFKGPSTYQDGNNPRAGVILGNDGNLYGTTWSGGGALAPSGIVFRLVPYSGGKWYEQVLYSFTDNNDGSSPGTRLVLDASGDLWGATTGAGYAGNGTIFQLRGSGRSWTFTALYNFAPSPDGAYPVSLRFAPAGGLYGTSQYGGNSQACANYGCGTVFEYEP